MILDEIIKNKKLEVEGLKKRLKSLNKGYLDEFPPPRDFLKAISKGRFGIIAEAKKASPSAGELVRDYNPTILAKNYEEAGASAVSVLTDEKYFMGDISHINEAKDSTTVPILRKDFIIDESQIYESRIAGADAILLIARILNDSQLNKFLKTCHGLGMEALVETHNAEEIERALMTDARVIGINNRDLDTLKVDLNATISLLKQFPGLKERIVVSESGIKSKEDIKALKAAGANAALIGETLLKSPNVTKTLQDLLS